ncbi:MAG: UDP-N-acetylmuramate--L-alanine ligase [Rhodanobacter sp.]|jgi:UDP-N-acetylmuramate--alanine ligase|nr:UDP-N-acetylmuramate--L-alanine ligase [Rhodanobacter sp.]
MTSRRLQPHEDMMSMFRRVHFIGIGGVGMSGIAEVLHNLGYAVSGSDRANSPTAQRLQKLGIDVHVGHAAEHIGDADVVVTSSAIKQDNPELVAARAARIPVIPRAEMLGELMRFRRGVAIAGTHGKTTTTSLTASVLAEGGYDPTFVIGGQLNAAGANARLGTGQYLVAEADESDGSFLLLSPVIAAVTNIDADHLENYGGDFAQLKKAFSDFLHRLPFYGLAVLCVDDAEVAELARTTPRRVMTYGIDAPDADVRISNLSQHGFEMHFDLWLPGRAEVLPVKLNLPGRHNVLNALAAATIGWQLGVEAEAIARALEHFQGVGRRFHRRGELALDHGSVLLVDDYGHHPRELAAVFDAVRGGWPDRRLVVGFQPHRYSRTRDLLDDFANVLAEVDVLVLTDVYPAGETPIAGADGRALARAVRARGKVDPVLIDHPRELKDTLPALLHDGDVLLLLGAGDIGAAALELAQQGQLRTPKP